MSVYNQDILNYGDDVKDLDCSPYEHLRMLHDRTEIEKNIHLLDRNEKNMLIMYDAMLLSKLEEMLEQISQVYDFSLSDVNNISIKYWWWHLDKIANGKLEIKYNVSVDKVM